MLDVSPTGGTDSVLGRVSFEGGEGVHKLSLMYPYHEVTSWCQAKREGQISIGESSST